MTESSLLQAIAAFGVLPIQASVIAQVSIRMVIKAETIGLLPDTLVVGVVWIFEGVGVDPALFTVSF